MFCEGRQKIRNFIIYQRDYNEGNNHLTKCDNKEFENNVVNSKDVTPAPIASPNIETQNESVPPVLTSRHNAF